MDRIPDRKMHARSPSNGILWPHEAPRHRSPHAEKKVFEALARQLPRAWHAWHSLRLRSKHRGEFSEADFVLADPKRPSILILEVKGGQVEQRGGYWYQNGKKMKMAPLDQALNFRKHLIQRFRESNVQLPSVGVATCFPDTFFSAQPRQDDLRGLVIGGQDLPYLDKILPDVMRRAVPKPRRTSAQWLRFLHDLWGDTWVPELRLGQKVKIEEEHRIRLDKEQLRRLEEIEENDRIIIMGSAGTGKTLLAREAAIRQAARNKQVLLLCFTEALGRWLAKSITHPNITAKAIRVFAAELLGETVPEDPGKMPSEYWETISIKAALEGLPSQKDLWDCVIVDEGQDLSADDWELVRECLNEDGTLWIFADEGQKFWNDRGVPKDIRDQCFVVRLYKPYRCPPGIQNLADSYLDMTTRDSELLINAVKEGSIRIVPCSRQRLIKQVGVEINRFISNGIAPAQVAVISVRGRRARESISRYQKIGDHHVVPATAKDAESNIICDTF